MEKKEKPFFYGGQAVIEGVMMMGRESYAVSCRQTNGRIVCKQESTQTIKNKYPVLKLPIIRGFVNFVEMLILGMSTLTWSANQSGEEEEELGAGGILLSVVIALVFVIGLFFFLPVWAGTAAHPYIGDFGRSLLEGVIRIALFVIYILCIRRLKDIRRVFEYHGAEHKTINAYEHGDELTPENVQKHTTVNLRCGTSFLLMVMIFMIIIFTFVGQTQGTFWRVVIKLALLPVVTGLTYEFTRWSARHCGNVIVRILIQPGLWLQHLTTEQPALDQLEVAIHSLRRVLPPDHPQYLAPEPESADVDADADVGETEHANC